MNSPRPPVASFFLLGPAAALVGGCATAPCKIPPPPSSRPATKAAHVIVVAPLATLQRELDAELRRLGPRPIPLPAAARLIPGVGALSIALSRATLLPAEGDGVKLEVVCALRRDDRELTRATGRLHLRPRLEGHAVLLALRPTDLETLQLELSRGAKAEVEAELRRVLPGPLRRLLPAEQLLALLTKNGYAFARATLLERVGTLGRVKVALPDLALTRAAVSSHAAPSPHLRVALFTSLPVRRGFDGPVSPPSHDVRIAIAGSALAELANEAMRRRLLPARYDSRLRPQANGTYRPIYDWRVTDPRPLKLIVTKTSSPCARVTMGGRAQLRLEGDKIVIGVRDGQVERVEGAPLTRLWVWLRELWRAPISRTRQLVTGFTFTVGRRRIALDVHAARATPRGVEVDLRARRMSVTPAAPRLGQRAAPAGRP